MIKIHNKCVSRAMRSLRRNVLGQAGQVNGGAGLCCYLFSNSGIQLTSTKSRPKSSPQTETRAGCVRSWKERSVEECSAELSTAEHNARVGLSDAKTDGGMQGIFKGSASFK